MIIDLNELMNKNSLEINEKYSFSKEELKDTEIISLNNLMVKGYIYKNSLNSYDVNILLKGTMVLPCSVTLKEVNHDFECKIEGNLEEIYEEFGEKLDFNQKTIDILPIIWENILMEIPIKVVSDDISDVKTNGEGWELITEEVD